MERRKERPALEILRQQRTDHAGDDAQQKEDEPRSLRRESPRRAGTPSSTTRDGETYA